MRERVERAERLSATGQKKKERSIVTTLENKILSDIELYACNTIPSVQIISVNISIDTSTLKYIIIQLYLFMLIELIFL